ncbi:MAG: MOSC domain-containing protein [Myxococcaceae bacterium]|jgi:hypothetical protein|nr:MOSC domain-containing protein [Myxococcaceae bacterium]
MTGRVTGLAVCRPGARVESEPALVLELTAEGVEGDRHFGPTLRAGPRQRGIARGTLLPNTRQVSLVSREECAAVAQALGLAQLDFTWLSANVEVEGLPRLSAVALGWAMRFEGGACLRLEGENEPCRKAGRVVAARSGQPVEAAFVKAAWQRRGLLARVEAPGVVHVGARVRLEPP